MAAHGVPLESRWADYYRRGYVPDGVSEEIRVPLLRGKTVGPFDGPARDRASMEVRTLTDLGYDVERGAVDVDGATRATYRVTNPDHRPTPEQFAAIRKERTSATVRSRERNGSGNGHRSVRQVVAAMLPALGDRLVATVVGFDENGAPYIVLTGENGWRYSCTVDRSDAPRV